MPTPKPITSAEGQKQRFIAAFSTPITFYGKVVDQHGAAVPDAEVKLSAHDKIMRPSSEYLRRTDQNGFFSITGIVGLKLAVAVSKAGYLGIPHHERQPTSSGLFDFYDVGAGSHHPDKNAPVIFRLYRLGKVEPLVEIREKGFRMTRDGAPLSISLDQQGGHQVVLRCWNQEMQRPEGQRYYDWRLEIAVPDGGLRARKDNFEFEAPEDGYLPGDIVEMPASLGNQWRDFAERHYFLRFEDGTVARANLRMRAGGDHFVVWESFFNPKVGSRNLEYNPNQEAAAR